MLKSKDKIFKSEHTHSTLWDTMNARKGNPLNSPNNLHFVKGAEWGKPQTPKAKTKAKRKSP